MLNRTTLGRIGVAALGLFILAGSMGGGCDIGIGLPGIGPIGPPVGPIDEFVTVELVNTTDFPVDPFLFVDPFPVDFIEDLLVEENFILIDPPVEPGEIVTLDFFCEDIGSVVSDRPLLLVGPDAFEADNSPVLIVGEDFFCGDLISIIYIDDPATGEFFQRIEINGIFLTDTD